jgi:hypothetical protein
MIRLQPPDLVSKYRSWCCQTNANRSPYAPPPWALSSFMKFRTESKRTGESRLMARSGRPAQAQPMSASHPKRTSSLRAQTSNRLRESSPNGTDNLREPSDKISALRGQLSSASAYARTPPRDRGGGTQGQGGTVSFADCGQAAIFRWMATTHALLESPSPYGRLRPTMNETRDVETELTGVRACVGRLALSRYFGWRDLGRTRILQR